MSLEVRQQEALALDLFWPLLQVQDIRLLRSFLAATAVVRQPSCYWHCALRRPPLQSCNLHCPYCPHTIAIYIRLHDTTVQYVMYTPPPADLPSLCVCVYYTLALVYDSVYVCVPCTAYTYNIDPGPGDIA